MKSNMLFLISFFTSEVMLLMLFQTPSLLSKTSKVGSSLGNNFTSDDSSLPSICSERNDSKPQSLSLNELDNSSTTMKYCHEIPTDQAISKNTSASHTLKTKID